MNGLNKKYSIEKTSKIILGIITIVLFIVLFLIIINPFMKFFNVLFNLNGSMNIALFLFFIFIDFLVVRFVYMNLDMLSPLISLQEFLVHITSMKGLTQIILGIFTIVLFINLFNPIFSFFYDMFNPSDAMSILLLLFVIITLLFGVGFVYMMLESPLNILLVHIKKLFTRTTDIKISYKSIFDLNNIQKSGFISLVLGTITIFITKFESILGLLMFVGGFLLLILFKDDG